LRYPKKWKIKMKNRNEKNGRGRNVKEKIGKLKKFKK